MAALGQTINVMTLAVGILVDDATVEIENIHRNLHQGKPLVRAILDGAQQVAVPAFVASLSIALVFIGVGIARTNPLSVFADGHGRWIFGHCVVHLVAHVGANHGALLAARRTGSAQPSTRLLGTAARSLWGPCSVRRGYSAWLDGVLAHRGLFF